MSSFEQRRRLLKAAISTSAISALPARQVFAQENKQPPLRIIVPLPAGGVADASVRFFAEAWTGITKQNVVIDNRPGGNYLIGVQNLLNAPADGNTWIHLNNGMSAAQATFGRYDMLKQMSMIGLMGSTPGALFVGQSSPFKTFKELIDWMKANPGKANYGALTGSVDHLLVAGMLKHYGVTATMVPFKGGPDSCTALAQNEIHFLVTALPLIVPFKGRIRPLATMLDQRTAMTPDVPTYKEAGMETPSLNLWGAFAAPAASPRAVIEAHYKTAVEVLKVPALVTKYAQQGMFAQSAPPETLAKMIAEEIRWMSPIAAELNLKAG